MILTVNKRVDMVQGCFENALIRNTFMTYQRKSSAFDFAPVHLIHVQVLKHVKHAKDRRHCSWLENEWVVDGFTVVVATDCDYWNKDTMRPVTV